MLLNEQCVIKKIKRKNKFWNVTKMETKYSKIIEKEGKNSINGEDCSYVSSEMRY